METTAAMGSSDSVLLSSGPMAHPGVRRAVYWALGIRTAADALPGPLQVIVNNGKMSVAIFFGVYLLFVSLWLPFWLFSFLVSEWGVYVLAIGFIFLVGRGVIRMIAFPGSSARVTSEIEREFAKYSVKMIVSSCNSLLDLASAMNASGPAEGASTGAPSSAYYEIPLLWKRAKSYRDRVLAVYAEVLSYILNDGQQTSNSVDPALTKHGSNRLSGDVGDLSALTLEARADGKLLLEQLAKVLAEVDRVETQAKEVLESPAGQPKPMPPSAKTAANSMVIAVRELRDFVESLKPPPSADSAGSDSDEEGDLSVDGVRRKFEEQNGSLTDSVKSGLSSILPMLDPPPHTSIFGFDMQRGCTLSRYRGGRQLWIQRPGGGMIDVLHIPANSSGSPAQRNPRAVMYCNPNAGLIEVAAGMSLAGGNVMMDADATENDNCWADFYTNMGVDVYLFNYAGFGRSYGAGGCGVSKRADWQPFAQGAMERIKRICHSCFIGFQPTPETLRADGVTVGTHLLSNLGVENLVIHGESIGGVAASGAARKLAESQFSREKVSLLICDRTFCNLEAVAQRLVGGWSGYAIRMLAPFWSTDVTNDFLNASCRKVVANDSADTMIFDSSSLKSGIAFWKEIHRGSPSTKGIGWMMEAPLQYRMADFDNACVNDSRFAHTGFSGRTSPVWPADKYITLEEGFHFAACAKRIGKVASLEKKKYAINDPEAVMGGDSDCPAPAFQMWKFLGTCDGLCGAPLGMAVRGGFDVTVAWLCSTLTFGGQTVVEGVEHRSSVASEEALQMLKQPGQIEASDFDCRPSDFQKQETDSVVHPKPIPEVVGEMKKILEENPNDEVLAALSHEVSFVIGTLEYVVARLSSQAIAEASWQNRHMNVESRMGVGSFLNLHCGHNNPFTSSERQRLRALVTEAFPMPVTATGSS